MSRFTRTIHIDAPAPDIWAAIVDVETWPQWASQFKRMDRLDAGPLALNSRVRVRPKGQLASVWQVTEYEDGRSFTWASNLVPGLRVTGGHLITSDGAGTSAEFWLDASGLLGTLLGPVLRRVIFSRNTRRATTGLKAHMEKRAPVAD
jgi:uncharacterized membrane protein